MGKVKTTGIIFESVGEMGGYCPSVPVSEAVSFDDLTAGDDDPMFVTLPAGQVDAESRNGRRYNRDAVEAIVEAINSGGVGGIKGHLRDEERAYRYDVPSVYWIGATLESNGTAYMKGYIPRTAPELREHVRLTKATRGRLGTSIYGTAMIDDDGNVSNLNLESIDLAHPARVGVPVAAATPHITGEMSLDDNEDEIMPEPMNSQDPTTRVEVRTVEPTEVAEMKEAHKKAVRELQEKISELQGKANDLDEIVKLLGETDDPVLGVKALQTQIASLEGENVQLLEATIQKQVEDSVAVASMRPMIAELVKAQNPTRRQDVSEALQTVLGKNEVKIMLKHAVETTAGPAQKRPLEGGDPGDNPERQTFIHIPSDD